MNLLAEVSPGFVWRLKDDASDNATSIAVTADPRLIINMSVWESADTLFDFVYRGAHTSIMARRRQFFVKPADNQAYQVLWWVPAGSAPTISDGLARLWHLDRFGPTPLAFTFKRRFTAPDQIARAGTTEQGRLVEDAGI